MANVKDTDYEYFAQDDFRVRKPDIKITFQGVPTSHEEIDVIVRLTNPLPIPLKKGLFQLEGPGIESQILMKVYARSHFVILNRDRILIVLHSIRLPKYQFLQPHQPHSNILHRSLVVLLWWLNLVVRNSMT